jgi:hypothetical protein
MIGIASASLFGTIAEGWQTKLAGQFLFATRSVGIQI